MQKQLGFHVNTKSVVKHYANIVAQFPQTYNFSSHHESRALHYRNDIEDANHYQNHKTAGFFSISFFLSIS